MRLIPAWLKDDWQKCPNCQARMKQEGLKTEHDLQSYFIQRIEKVINDHGRTLIGWSEIREGGLAQNAAIMDWIGGAVEAASAGHDVVIATHRSIYLCYYQSLERPANLQAVRPYLPLEQVYSFEPVPAELESEFSRHILGAEACLWKPYFSLMNEIEEMSFPRLCALAEVVWSPKSTRNWDDFKRRLDHHRLRLDQCAVNYWRDNSVQIGEWKPAQIESKDSLLEWNIKKQVVTPGKVRVSLNFLEGQNGLKIGWAALLEDSHEISRDAHVGFTGTDSRKRTKPQGRNYFFYVPAPKNGAQYSIRVSVSGDGGIYSSGVVFFELKPDKTPAVAPKGPGIGEPHLGVPNERRAHARYCNSCDMPNHTYA
jgi:hexosaminidase